MDDDKLNKIRKQINNTCDKLGCPLDDGIKELVILLNYHEIKTIASCEGHITHGEPFPWIDISFECVDLLFNVLHKFEFNHWIEFNFLKFESSGPIGIIRLVPYDKQRLGDGMKIFDKFCECLKQI